MSSDTEAATKPKPVKRKTSAEIKKARLERLRIAREGSLSTQQQAHEYLQSWTSQPNTWKFNKARQLWIIRHLYVESQIPTNIFHIAVNYLNQSSDSLRQTLVGDAQIVINPVMGKDDEQKRIRVLGQMPSHVTKGEAKALKKKKRDLAAGKPNDEETKDVEESETSEVPLSIRERAQCIIDTLSKPKPNVNVKDSADEILSEKPSEKRKSEDTEGESKEAKKAKKDKKQKKDKKDENKKDKKDKKSKKEKEDKDKKKDRKNKKDEEKKPKKEKKDKKSKDKQK
ncbi:hypothetical protein IWW36_001445 [Coemansia brasiliensis]|uniref:WKF domain-containing protein n=1 Tax=Coemansia brasiliensis TaxID=2650707 RepID=A0A9W8IBK4_9FUNG|nr:hypothetical protein IWW36_001445 [Coemansia brasiliensis]